MNEWTSSSTPGSAAAAVVMPICLNKNFHVLGVKIWKLIPLCLTCSAWVQCMQACVSECVRACVRVRAIPRHVQHTARICKRKLDFPHTKSSCHEPYRAQLGRPLPHLCCCCCCCPSMYLGTSESPPLSVVGSSSKMEEMSLPSGTETSVYMTLSWTFLRRARKASCSASSWRGEGRSNREWSGWSLWKLERLSEEDLKCYCCDALKLCLWIQPITHS